MQHTDFWKVLKSVIGTQSLIASAKKTWLLSSHAGLMRGFDRIMSEHEENVLFFRFTRLKCCLDFCVLITSHPSGNKQQQTGHEFIFRSHLNALGSSNVWRCNVNMKILTYVYTYFTLHPLCVAHSCIQLRLDRSFSQLGGWWIGGCVRGHVPSSLWAFAVLAKHVFPACADTGVPCYSSPVMARYEERS